MKKLLSILAAVGLTATASTAAVSCTSTVSSGQIAVWGANDLHINDADDFKNNVKPSTLDQYIENMNHWRDENASYADKIQTAINTKDQSKINTAAKDILIPFFSAVIDGKIEYSLTPEKLYADLHIDPTDLHDTADQRNKLELSVDMVKLGQIENVLAIKDAKFDEAIDVNVDKTADQINNYVHIKGVDGLAKAFGLKAMPSNKDIQKILDRPDHSVSGMKLEISTNPEAVIDTTKVSMKADETSFSFDGSNLNLITPANTKLVKDDGKTSAGVDLTFAATREEYKSDTVTLSKKLTAGKYFMVYTPTDGPQKGQAMTIEIDVQ